MKDAIDPIEQKRKVSMEINAYIGRIPLLKRNNLGRVETAVSHDHIDDFEEGRSSMIKSMRTSATPLTRKEKKGTEKTCAIASPTNREHKGRIAFGEAGDKYRGTRKRFR